MRAVVVTPCVGVCVWVDQLSEARVVRVIPIGLCVRVVCGGGCRLPPTRLLACGHVDGACVARVWQPLEY